MEHNLVKRLFKLTFVLSIAISLLSCASTDEMDKLDSSLRSYERAVRWGDFTRAKSFHKNNPALDDLERRRLKLYRVTDYRVISQEVPNLNNAYLLVEIKYYKNDRPVIKTTSVQQEWKRDEGSTIWYLNSSFPKFR